MPSYPSFEKWVLTKTQLTRQDLADLDLMDAYEVIVSRIETATRRGAIDPLVTVSSKRAGGNSRQSTNRRLDLLGYTVAQRRIVHRLLTGTPSGFPGLLALYLEQGDGMNGWHSYVRRQTREYRKLSPPAGEGEPAEAPAVTNAGH